MFNVA